MSTKTIKQRIAVVAVSALTVGLFSVVSAPASKAAVGGATVAASNQLATRTQDNPKLTHYDRLFIATMPSSTGSGVALTAVSGADGTPDAAAGGGPATSSAKSLGLVNISDIAGGLTAGTTTTAVLLSTGALSVYTATAAGEYSAITVTGGTISSSTGTSLNATASLASHGGAGITTFGIVAKPSSGATTMTVRLYTGNASLALANAAAGDLEGQISVTIAAASTAGVLSPVYSGLWGASSATDQSNTTDDASYVGAAQYSNDMFLNVRVKDGYNTAINSGTAGVLSAVATGGALVALAAANANTDGTTTTAYVSTATPDDYMIRVSAPSTAPVITTVTVSFNGTVIGTKTMQFLGEVAKITLSSPVIGNLGTSTGNYASYRMYDASGAAVYASGPVGANTAYASSALLNDGSVATGTTTGGITKDRDLSITAASVVTTGRVIFTCGSTAGKGTVGVTFTNASGTVVKSNALAVTCAGDPYTYSASWDKASYIPGDIAKLTVTFKDSAGNLANDVEGISDSTTQNAPSVSIGGLDKTVSGPTSADTIEQGVVTYTYTVGATEGSYSGTVSFPVVNNRQIAVTGSAAAVTATLNVKAATAAVSNADVLKSIVSLIASINKQIRALQKLILRR